MKNLMNGPAANFFAIAFLAFLARLLFGNMWLFGGLISFFATPIMLFALFGGAAVLVKGKLAVSN